MARGNGLMNKQVWDLEYAMQDNLCMLFPIYKKNTEYSLTCKICKIKGCNKLSEPDPRYENYSNMCMFHFKWYNGMYDFLGQVLEKRRR